MVYKSSIPDEVLEDLMLDDNFGVFRRKSFSKTSVNGMVSGGASHGQNSKVPRAQNIF